MAAAAPAQLSGLAELLLRRPPSLRELVTLVGLRRRLRMVRGAGAPSLSPGGGGGAVGPRHTHEGGALRPALRGAALPPLRPVLRVLHGRGGRTALDLAAEGHPLRADGLRLRRPPRDVGRLPRGPLGPSPPGQAPRFPLRGTRRAAGGLAGVGRRLHPARDPAPHPRGRHTPGRPRRGAQGDRVRGGGAGLPPGSSPRPETSSWTPATTTGCTRGSPTPGRTR